MRSILVQTFADFEFIVVDDGSTDQSWDLLREFWRRDPRVRLIREGKNQGVAAASNLALEHARGKYLARMDADDVSLPERLAWQVQYMETHPDVGILGGRMQLMDESGRLLASPPVYCDRLWVRWYSFFESPFANPTILLRKAVLERFGVRYDRSCIRGEEDYELWSRLLPLTEGANLGEILLYYRLHHASLTHRHSGVGHPQLAAIAARSVMGHLPSTTISRARIEAFHRALTGAPASAKRRRARLTPVFLQLWREFSRKYWEHPQRPALNRDVMAWAARLILFPPFQEGWLRALWLLTRTEARWPLYLVMRLPYFLARRRIRGGPAARDSLHGVR